MNEFLKLCKAQNIDIDGANALLAMAEGDPAKATALLNDKPSDKPDKQSNSAGMIKYG